MNPCELCTNGGQLEGLDDDLPGGALGKGSGGEWADLSLREGQHCLTEADMWKWGNKAAQGRPQFQCPLKENRARARAGAWKGNLCAQLQGASTEPACVYAVTREQE